MERKGGEAPARGTEARGRGTTCGTQERGTPNSDSGPGRHGDGFQAAGRLTARRGAPVPRDIHTEAINEVGVRTGGSKLFELDNLVRHVGPCLGPCPCGSCICLGGTHPG